MSDSPPPTNDDTVPSNAMGYIRIITTVVRDVGFPIVIALILLVRLEPAMVALTQSITWTSYVLGEVQKQLVSTNDAMGTMRHEHERILDRMSNRAPAPVERYTLQDPMRHPAPASPTPVP